MAKGSSPSQNRLPRPTIAAKTAAASMPPRTHPSNEPGTRNGTAFHPTRMPRKSQSRHIRGKDASPWPRPHIHTKGTSSSGNRLPRPAIATKTAAVPHPPTRLIPIQQPRDRTKGPGRPSRMPWSAPFAASAISIRKQRRAAVRPPFLRWMNEMTQAQRLPG